MLTSEDMSNGNMMSAIEALLGKSLGTCTIRSYTGLGRMGIVYLAVQLSPRRDVALKIVPPVAAHTPEERTAFAARFLRKSKALTALQHPHMLPIYDFGIEDGLAYLVMPYIRSGTLFDLLNREGTLSLANAARYLEQAAAALHYAHTHGIIHGDVTPSNIMLDADRRVLLSDFALTSIAMEKPASQMRLLRSGINLGSLAYQAPEQIMGESIGPATDMYALGIILFQMLTGQTPFQDSSPISLATQQVQAEPPAPRSLRPELPAAAEQVILRALAKSSSDRYASAQEMARDFLAAVGLSASLQFSLPAPTHPSLPETPPSAPTRQVSFPGNGLFVPHEQIGSPSGIETTTPDLVETRTAAVAPAFEPPQDVMPVAVERRTDTVEHSPASMQTPLPPTRLGLGRKARMLRVEKETAAAQEHNAEHPMMLAPPASAPPTVTDAIAPLPDTPLAEESPTHKGNIDSAELRAQPLWERLPLRGKLPLWGRGNNHNRPLPVETSYQDDESTKKDEGNNHNRPLPVEMPARELPTTNPGVTGTMKLPAAMKIVQVPVAGQPGRYVTGLLPVQTGEAPDGAEKADEDEGMLPETSPARAFTTQLKTRAETLPMRQKISAAALVALIILGSASALIFARGHSGTAPKTITRPTTSVPNIAATFNAQATATASANSILVDTLSQNIHNWPIEQKGVQLYFFSGGAYHIFDNASGRSAPAFLPGFTLKEPLVYTLTMDEIKGNDSSINNSFGMILFFSTRNKSGHNDVTFYSFEVVNAKGGQYQFWKYDSSKGSSPWTSLWHHTFGKEYHQGQGTKYHNTFAVAANKGSFTFLVNGHKVGSLHDSSFDSGEIGMLVNLKGTEVAFSQLQLTYNLQTG